MKLFPTPVPISTSTPRVILLHETNPAKYFPAVHTLADRGEIALEGSYRTSVIKEWVRAWKHDRLPLRPRTANALSDARFRLRLPTLRNRTIVLGFAPWDFRLLYFLKLPRHNRVIYHTSWPDWTPGRVPRQSRGPASWLLQRVWRRFLRHPNVQIVATSPDAARGVESFAGKPATVIPHAVPKVFFTPRPARTPGHLKLLFVGEVSSKKGIPQLIDLMHRLKGTGAQLTVVGSGAMADDLMSLPPDLGISCLGPIQNRGALAGVMHHHDILLLLSQKQPRWQELFGIVLIEALAAGMGVIASNHTGPRQIFAGQPDAPLFDEQDIDAVENLLRHLAENPCDLARFKSRFAHVAQDFKIDRIAFQWRQILRAEGGGH